MNDDDLARSAGQSEETLRVQLQAIVDDVEPAQDALPRLLVAARRRGHGHQVVRGTGIVAVAAVAAVVLVLVMPKAAPTDTTPVGVATSSYVTQTRPGVLAYVDIGNGQTSRRIAQLSGPVTALAAYHKKVYAAVPGRIVGVSAEHEPRVVTPRTGRVTALTASDYGVAYLSGDIAVVQRGDSARRIPVPPQLQAVDVALASDGRLAVLTTSTAPETGGVGVHIVGANSTFLPPATVIEPVNGCVSLAITWSGSHLAALRPVNCQAWAGVRVATFDPESGRLIGGGVPFRADRSVFDDIQLSAGRLGRFLVSTGAKQWLIDGSAVRRLPQPCEPSSACADVPAVLTGLP